MRGPVPFLASALPGAAALALLTACSARPPEGVVPEHPDFTGAWVLNAEASKDPSPEELGERPPSPGREGGLSRERTPVIGGGILPPVAFRISEDDSTLTVSGVDGRRRVIFLDGRTITQRVEGLGNVRITAFWKGQKLVVERQLESGPRVIESYGLTEDGRQLAVTIRIEAARSFEFLRVFDAAPAEP
jgi:hypothetical protein